MADGVATRELLELNINEISLVDSAANEKVFVIVKSTEVDDMAQKQESALKKNKDVEEAQEVETAEEVEKSEVVEAETVEEPETETVEEPEVEEPEAETVEEPEVEEPEAETAEEPEVEVAKASPSETEAIDTMINALQKAKALTPTRQAQLTTAIGALQKLLGEVAANTPAPSVPVEKSNAVEVTKATKAVEDKVLAVQKQLTAQIAELVETNKALNERVELIEKTRQPSTSVDEGGTDAETVVEKRFWAGVL